MTEQETPQGRPEFEPPGGDRASQPVPPSQPYPAHGYPPQHYPPPYPPPAQHGGYPPFLPPQPRPAGGRGSIWLGVGITIAALLASWVLAVSVGSDGPLATALGMLAAGLPFALVLGGIVLAAIPRTTRTGAGILIGIGAAILIAGGLCFALVLGLGSGG